MPYAFSVCFERLSYILVSTEYLSIVACNGQEVKSIVVSRGVCYCTEFDLVSSFLPCDCLLFSLLLACCMGSFVGKVYTSLAFRSEMTGFEMIPDMLFVNVFPAVFVRPSDFKL